LLRYTTLLGTMEADDTLMFDDAPDNDGIDYSSHYSAQRPYRSHQFNNNNDREEDLEDPVKGNVWGRLGSLLDFVTGPRFAFVVAIVVVLVFQFQGKNFIYVSWWMHHAILRMMVDGP
jgi:hypothetical protein